ncbi:hypothetical protein ACFQPF_09765 [Fictibacillus iocasae]|uniref:Uncharacterized protein n=1 Tax=Fictibacillus iocasae TaxID=2715437 RepID=A0ABW2NQV3_9BACL
MTAIARNKEIRIPFKSYFHYVGWGLVAGILTRLTDFFPNDDIWSFSSIATLFGFWIVTVTLITYYSSSNQQAAVNVLVYLFAMNISFYMLKYALGFFVLMFNNDGFQWSLFILYSIVAVVCSAISYVLYFWNKENKWSNVLYALPISGLAAETIGVGIYLYNNHTFLFQFMFNFLSFMLLFRWFYQKANHKLIYLAAITVTTLIVYSLIYRPFL